MPGTAEEWRACERNFNTDWNFPRAIGAIDGKHIMLQAPIHGGSEYYNYKGIHGIVLFALVDAKYNFLFADIGCQGRISDGGIFKNTKLYTKIMNGTMSLPENAPLPGRRTRVPSNGVTLTTEVTLTTKLNFATNSSSVYCVTDIILGQSALGSFNYLLQEVVV